MSVPCPLSPVPSPPVPAPTSPAPPVDAEVLRALLDAALADPPESPEGGGVALGVHRRGDGVDVAVHPLMGPDPVRSLYGFVAPPEWFAFGIVAGARVRRLEGPRSAGPGDEAASRVDFGLLMTRQGHSVVAARGDGELVDQIHRIDAGERGEGRIPDACRRALGLATAPPSGDTAELWATLWVETLLVRTLGDPRPIPWDDAARAYPAFDAVVDGDATLSALVSEHLVELGQAARRAWPWEQLLAACAAGQVPACGIDPADARWMDVGMFSREVLGQFPPIDDLVVDLGTVLAPDVATRIVDCLDGWGVR